MSISTSEAVRRVEAIVPMLADDVCRAIELHQTMEAANQIVSLPLRGRQIDWAEPYGIIQNTLSLMLAVNVARIFDVSTTRPLDKQDKASIPILAHHLGKADVQDEFIAKARCWTPQWPDIEETQTAACRTAIDKVLYRWVAIEGAEALRRVREIRDKRLAHSLYDKEPDALPFYGDLFTLLDAARDIATAAVLAVGGRATKLDWFRDKARQEADRFWTRVLPCLTAQTWIEP